MKKTKVFVSLAIILVVLLGLFSALAYQGRVGWSGTVDFWEDKVSDNIREADSDTYSNIKWTFKENYGSFRIKLYAKSHATGSTVTPTTWFWINEDKQVNSTTAIDRYYDLYAARENVLDPGVYVEGNWEP